MMQVHYRAVLKGMRPISEDTDHESAWTVLKENCRLYNIRNNC